MFASPLYSYVSICTSSDDEEDNPTVSEKLRKQVVDLLQNGTETELQAVPNMNPKKLELLTSNRPYDDWATVVNDFA